MALPSRCSSRAARPRWRRALAAVAAASLLAACGGGGDDSPPSIPPYWTYGGVVAADFDGDGRADIAVAATWVDGPPPHAGYVIVHLANALGFDPAVQYPVAPDPWGLSVGHFGSATRLDLVAASPETSTAAGASGQLSVLAADPLRPGGFGAVRRVSTGGYTEFAAIGDVNDDGLPDLVADDAVLSRARLLVQDHDLGTALQPVSLGAGHASLEMAVADIDGDGLQDVVVATWDDVVVLPQRASGGFGAPLHLIAGLHVQDVAVADLDGDGRLDIVAVNNGDANAGAFTGASVTVMLQRTRGVFTTTTTPLPGGANQVAIGDLDGDGLPDLAVVSLVYQAITTPSRVSMLFQSPTARGTFSLPVVVDGPQNGTSIAIGDVDGDGWNDIVVNDGPSVLVQSATVHGRFSPARRLGS